MAALGFFKNAFAKDAKLLDDMEQQNRYNAACAAIRRGREREQILPKLWRSKGSSCVARALTWLKDDLAYWLKQIAANKPAGQSLAKANLRRWQFDPISHPLHQRGHRQTSIARAG